MLVSLMLLSAMGHGAPAMGAVSQRVAQGSGPGGLFVEDRPAPRLQLPTIDGRSTLDLGRLPGRRAIVLQFASW